jgi:UDPglucose--hexose-1-phosphate uridylyltransferase
MIEPALGRLLAAMRATGLIGPADIAYARNRVLEVLGVFDYDLGAEPTGAVPAVATTDMDELLRPLLDDAARRGLIEPDTRTQRDLWDTAIMGCFVDSPSVVVRRFWDQYSHDPVAATDSFHQQAVASNYIRASRTDRNITWRQPTRYGVMDMTINVSKPEKDPRDIIASAAHGESAAAYPRCLLCRENEGYAGRADHSARQNLRLIPMNLAGQQWYLQYSPYRYYNEHCIVLSDEHRPMRVDRGTFERLSEFTSILPHYLVGSNADLPIVGGSILSHDHFQGGRFEFAMDRADQLWSATLRDVQVDVLKWPLSVIRLTGHDAPVIDYATDILAAWREYSDPDFALHAYSAGTAHNTITPIARRIGDQLRLDLVLRNNRTTDEHPEGLFHPHSEIHPVKKENIGLIEVMGLAVLPGRLETELEAVAGSLLDGTDLDERYVAHQPMVDQLRAEGPVHDLRHAVQQTRLAAGELFVRGLEHCGVFAVDPVAGCRRFLETVDASL